MAERKNKTGRKLGIKERLLSPEDMMKFLNVKKTWLYGKIKMVNDFPRPILLADSTPRWRLSEVNAYLDRQPREWRNKPHRKEAAQAN